MLRRLCLIPALLVLLATGCGDSEASRERSSVARESGRADNFAVERIMSGLVRPTWVGAAPGDRGALYVLEQPGRMLRIDDDGRKRTVLDLRNEVKEGAEQGLLGLAFHPDFARNGRFFVHWSNPQGDTRVAEFTRGKTGRRMLLALEQPEANHNGGQLAFGPDGRLYLGLGDGGGAFDPRGNGQRLDTLLGKLVSTNVDSSSRPRWRVELYGLRNPWRFSFDPGVNDVWIGDVGQDAFEEVDRVQLEPDEPPKNLGWGAYEGEKRIPGKRLDRRGEVLPPVAVYSHEDGCSITGGVVYRGTRVPELAGRYVYGDFCTGVLWSLKPKPGRGARDVRREKAAQPQLTHIGIDLDGELHLASANGEIARVVRASR